MSFPQQEIIIRQMGREEDSLLLALVEVVQKEEKENVIEDITSLDSLFLIKPGKIKVKQSWRANKALK